MAAVGLSASWLATLSGDVAFTPDSANYVEQARSLLAGKGFRSRPYGLQSLDVSQRPDSLFPPGYPVMIAAGSALSSLPAEMVAPWINRVALMVLPITVFLALRLAIGICGAACLSVLAALSPGVITWGRYALSDVVSLPLVVTSLGMTLAAWSPSRAARGWILAFGGGLTAGFAYLTRNAHVALLLSVPVSMGTWSLACPPRERARTWRIGLSWALGVSVVVLPWLARNVAVFGRMQPYYMPPSTVSAWSNLNTFISAHASEVLGWRYPGTLAGWDFAGLATLLLMVVVAARVSSHSWSTLTRGEQRAFLFSLVYALFGAVVVIAARTRYQWGESISDRHTLQYALWGLVPMAIAVRNLPGHRAVRMTATVAIMVTLVTLRCFSVAGEMEREQRVKATRRSIATLIDESRAAETGACARGRTPLVVSNYAFLYRILCDADARHPGDVRGLSPSEVAARVRSSIGRRALLLVLHPGRGVEGPGLPLSDANAQDLSAQGWTVRENSPESLVLAGASTEALNSVSLSVDLR